MFADLLRRVLRREDLTEAEAASAMDDIIEGRVAPAQVAGLLVALAMKGERPAEIVGFARVMRDRAVPIAHAAGHVGRPVRHRRRRGRARSTSRRPRPSWWRRAASPS